MRILITGGSGFLGVNLVRYLIARGVKEITILDIAPVDLPDLREKVLFIRGDIRDRTAVVSALPGQAGIVVHAAAALPRYPGSEIFSTEVDGARTLLAESLRSGVDRFIHISSTAVYGIPDRHPIRETDPLAGMGPYGRAKILAEEVCGEYRRTGLCITILRPKTFVGPERLGVFALLYEWAREGRNFPIIGSGNNRYQLLDVEDLSAAIWSCITGGKTIVNDTFNIGARAFTTMREDFQAVLDAAGFGKKVIGLPAAPAILMLKLLGALNLSPLYPWVYETAAKDSVVSIEKAERMLGFSPRFSNRDALVRNFHWYCEHLDSIANRTGITHRVPWNPGILKWVKHFF